MYILLSYVHEYLFNRIENGKNNGIGESPLLIIIPMETIDDVDKYDINMKIKVVVKATRISSRLL